jgi:hypothetical protein
MREAGSAIEQELKNLPNTVSSMTSIVINPLDPNSFTLEEKDYKSLIPIICNDKRVLKGKSSQQVDLNFAAELPDNISLNIIAKGAPVILTGNVGFTGNCRLEFEIHNLGKQDISFEDLLFIEVIKHPTIVLSYTA